ncbi:MAG: cadherin-like domain-containing protein [Leptolyngbyaceae cyanobacterium]
MANKTQSIVFVDAGIDAPAQVVAGLAGNIEALILSPAIDGVAQITAALASRPHVTDVYIVAHGAPGELAFGHAQLGLATLPAYRAQLRQWATQSQLANIYLYGCQVAAGDAGAEFLAALRGLTGANIAASAHHLGATSPGGQWTLETRLGEVPRRELLTTATQASYPGVLASDSFAGATPITPNNPLTGDNSAATSEAGEPIHDPTVAGLPLALQESINNSLWWSWTANVDGQVNVNTAGSDINTVLAVYTGTTVAGLTLIARNDDAAPGNTTSSVNFNASNGTTYFFAVDGVGTVQTTTPDGITITLNTPPVIDPVQLFTIAENSAATTPLSDGVDGVVNATGTVTNWSITSGNPDNDGDSVRAFAINATTGELTVNDPGDLNFEGGSNNYELEITAKDGAGFSDTETVFVQVTDVNEAPAIVSLNVPAAAFEGTPVSVTGQIFDPDQGDTQTLTIDWGDGTTSTLTNDVLVNIDANGNKSFTATHIYADNNVGGAPFNVSVTLEDGAGLTAPTEMRSIAVGNVAPVIAPDGPITLTINEDNADSFFLTATDASSVDVLNWSVGTPSNGTVTPPTNPAAANQTFTYTPDANFSGTDSFQIQVGDDDGGFDTIDVNVTVAAQPDAPTNLTITPSSDTINEGETVTLTGSFIDPDAGDLFTLTINWGDGSTDTLSDGDLLFDGSTNTYSFSTDHQYLADGTPTISVSVQDDFGEITSTSQSITVSNVAPTLFPGSTSLTVQEDDTGTRIFTATDPADTTFAWSILTNGANGTASVSTTDTGATQSVTYTPNADFNGLDQFVVQVDDQNGGVTTATVTVGVLAVNDDPTNLIITPDVTSLNEGSAVTLAGSFDDVDNSTDAFFDDTHTLTVDWGDGTVETFKDTDLTLGGAATDVTATTLAFDGLTHTYVDEGTGSYTVTVTAADAAGQTVATTQAIAVLNVDPTLVDPAASPATLALTEDTAEDFTVKATDVGIEDILTWDVTAAPTSGTVTATTSAANGEQSFTYTPNLNFEGTDTFTLQVTDGDGGFQDLVYNVTVTGANDAPQVIVNNFNIVEDTPLDIDLSVLNAIDVEETDDNNINFTITGAAAGSFLVDGTPDNTFSRQDIIDGKVTFLYGSEVTPSFTITVEDSAPLATVVPGTITSFLKVNDAPVLTVGTFTVAEGAEAPINSSVLSATDEDDDNATLLFTVSDVEGGDFILSGSETFSFTQQDINNGLVTFRNDGSETDPSFNIKVEDDEGAFAEGAGTGTVTAIDDDPEITVNTFTVVEGQVLNVDSTVLNATDDETTDSAQITFTVSGTDAGSFLLDGVASTTFTRQDIFAGRVTFLYEGEVDPVFDIKVEDGTGGDSTVMGNVISFTPTNDTPVFATLAPFTVNENDLTPIDNTILDATDADDDDSSLTFEVADVVGGDFLVEGLVANTFTQAQVDAGAVFFKNTGSDVNPSYKITVSDDEGASTVAIGTGTVVTTDDNPEITVNNFDVKEGTSLLVDSTVLNATDDETTDSAQITFTVSGTDAGSFLVDGVASTTFTRQDILLNRVTFLYDGEVEPVFDIKVKDGTGNTFTEAGNVVGFEAVNDTPLFDTLATFNVPESGLVEIDETIIKATDADDLDSSLIFTVKDIVGGDFLVEGQVKTTFTQAQVNASDVFFQNDGTETAPSFNIKVEDDEGAFTEATGTGTVTTANDAPTILTNEFKVTEGELLSITAAVLDATDEDSDDANILFTISGTDAGSFLVNGTASTTFTRQDISDGNVTFLYDGETSPVFSINVSDQETPAATIDVAGNVTEFTEVNDRPEFLNLTGGVLPTFNVNEVGNAPITNAIVAATDGDFEDSDLLFTVSGEEGGKFFIVGQSEPTQTFTQRDINLGRVFFQHDGNEIAPSYTITVSDSELTATATGTGTLTLSNDDPEITINDFDVVEGELLQVTSGVLNATDDETTDSTQITFTISGTDAGSFLVDGVASTTFTRQDIDLNRVTFLYEGEVDPVFDITVTDGTGGTVTKAGDVEFTAKNDAPVFDTLNTFAVAEGGLTLINNAILNATDADDLNSSLLFTVSGEQGGKFLVNGVESSSFTQGQVNANDVFFQNDGTETPPSFNIKVEDDEGAFTEATGTGTVNATDDPPEIQANNFTVTEGVALQVTQAILDATDEDTADAQITFTIGGTDAGSFLLNGTPSTTFTREDILNGNVTFLYEGEGSPVFTIAVSDGTTTLAPVSGGIDDFTAVNDAPDFNIVFPNVAEDDIVDITTSVFVTTDAELTAGLTTTDDLVYTVDVTANGRFVIDGGDDPATKFTQADIESGLVDFVLEGEEAPSFTVTLNDGGSPVAENVTKSITPADFTFTPTNDLPLLLVNNLEVDEGDTVTLGTDNLFASDVETPAFDLEFTVSNVVNGTFNKTTFTLEDIIQGEVTFTHDDSNEVPGDASSLQASYDVVVSDGTDTSSDPIGAAAAVTVNPINDAPVLLVDNGVPTDPDPFLIDEGGTLILNETNILATDTDTLPENLTFTVTNLVGGFFATTTDPTTPITTFTQADINSPSTIVFVHDDTETVPSYTLKVEDDGGNSDTQNYIAQLADQNDDPEITLNTLTLAEGDKVTLTTSNLQVTDEESGPADLTYTISNLTNGDFFNGATQLGNGDTFTQQDVIAGQISFEHNDLNDAPTYTLEVADNGTPPGSDTSVAAIAFTAINDDPVLDGNTTGATGEFSITQGGTANVTQAQLEVTDEETTNPALLVYTVDGTTNGNFLLNGVANPPTFTQQDINTNRVSFAHDGSETAPTYTVTVTDNGVPEAKEITFTVDLTATFTQVNENPMFTASQLSPVEGELITLTAADINATDREDAATLLEFSIDPANVTGGDFFLNGVALGAADTFSLVQINAGLVTFKDDGDEVPPSFEVTVTDTDGGTVTETATINVDNFQVNDDPTLDVNAFTLNEGQVLILDDTNLKASDAETTDPAQLTYTVTPPEGGGFFLNGLTPTTTFTQEDINNKAIAFKQDDTSTEPSFTITVTDPDGGETSAEAIVTFTSVNDTPTANDDSGEGFTTNEDTAFTTPDLTLNDTDEEGTPLTVSQVNGGVATLTSGATVTINGNSINYDPNGQFEDLAVGETKTDTFTYTLSDNDPMGAETDTATVTIVIEGANDAPTAVADTGATNENTTTVIDVLANDSDPDTNDTLTILSVDTTGVLGQVTNNGTTLTYNPTTAPGSLEQGEIRTEVFTYVVSDGNGGTASNSVTVTVTGVNDGPIAVDDAGEGFATDDNQSLTTAVLTLNDSDPDDDLLTVTKINGTAIASGGMATLPSNGQVTLNANNSVTYTPSPTFKALSVGQSTTDTFTYTIDDGKGGTDDATVTIVINGANEAPVATDDITGFTTTEGTEITLNVLGNDTDDDGDSLVIQSVDTTGLTGQVINNGGDLTYIPALVLKGGETVEETFTYTVSDGNGGTDTADVKVTVTGVNDAPIAITDSGGGFITNELTAFVTANVLANDSDPEGSLITLTSFDTSGTQGLVTSNSNGTFNYDPNGAFNTLPQGRTATDSFSYTVQDADGLTSTATVNIQVNGLLSEFFDFERFLQEQNPAAVAPADTIAGLPLAQLYDENFYLSQNLDVASAVAAGGFSSGYQHFVTLGINEGRNPSVLYNEAFYLSNNVDVANEVANGSLASGLAHFLNSGHIEGRDPSALFDQSDYLTANPDVANAVASGAFDSAFDHYVTVGAEESRLPSLSLYNESFYLNNNPDIAAGVANGTISSGYDHFISLGQTEGRAPSSLYNEASYLARNPDIVNAVNAGTFTSGFQHYEDIGRFEGRFVF